MSQQNDPHEMASRAAAGAAFPWLARALVIGRGNNHSAQLVAEAMGAPDRVKSILKAAVSAQDTSLTSALGSGYAQAQAAFVDQLGQSSAFFRIWAAGSAGFLRLPMRVRAVSVALDASAFLVGEGDPIPVSDFSLAGQTLEPQKVAAIVVATNELWRDTTASGQTFVSGLLRQAVSRTVDAHFLDALAFDAAPLATATTHDQTLAGLALLLDTVASQSGGNLFWVGGAAACARLSLTQGLAQPPSPTGGTLLGLPLILSSGIAADRLALVDAAGIAADLGLIELTASSEADLQLSSTPVDGASLLTSLFQTGSTALRAIVTFAFEEIRENTVAVMVVGEAA